MKKSLIDIVLAFFICSVASFALTTWPPAIDPHCDNLNKAWQGKFHSDFRINWVLEPFSCPSLTAKVSESINSIYQLSGKKISEAMIFPDFYNWIKQFIGRTEYQESHGLYGEAAASAQNGVLYIHRGFMNYDALLNASILIHESRHLQYDAPPHVICNHGVFIGKPYCDDSLLVGSLMGGGNNAAFHFLQWVYLAADRFNLDKTAAQKHICLIVSNNFNNNYQNTLEQYSCRSLK